MSRLVKRLVLSATVGALAIAYATSSEVRPLTIGGKDCDILSVNVKELKDGVVRTPSGTLKEALAKAKSHRGVMLDFVWTYNDKLLDRTMAEVKAADIPATNVILLAMWDRALEYFKKRYPEYPRFASYGCGCSNGKWWMQNDSNFKGPKDVVFTNMLAKAKRMDVEGLHLWRACDSNEVALAHKAGFKVFVWNVDTREHAAQFRAAGVDGWATSHPHTACDPDWIVKENAPDVRTIGRPLAGALAATGKVTKISFPVGARMRGIALMPCSTGTTAGVSLACADGTSTGWSMRAKGEEVRLPAAAAGKKRGDKLFLPDARLEVPYGDAIYGRPTMSGFWCRGWSGQSGVELAERWDYLPGASRRWYYFDVARDPRGGSDLYLNGEMLMRLGTGKRAWNWRLDLGPLNVTGYEAVTNMTVTLPAGWKYKIVEDESPATDGRFFFCDFAKKPRAKRFFGGTLRGLKEGFSDFTVPIKVASPDDAGDVAVARINQGQHSLECNAWMNRSPLWAYPAEVRFRVPSADYVRAHVLFALDPDTSKKRVLTVRLAHYLISEGGSGGSMVADTLVTCDEKANCFLGDAALLPRQQLDVQRVGAVEKDGVTCDIYRMTVPLDMGKLADVVDEKTYLDFEFLGETVSPLKNGTGDSAVPNNAVKSAFTIFGATLEQAPFRIAFRQKSPGNVFTADEPAENRVTGFDLTCVAPCRGTVRWVARDDAGEEVFDGARDFELKAKGETAHVEIPLGEADEVGLYTLDVSFESGADGVRALPAGMRAENRVCRITHRARFCVTPEAGRRTPAAKSPFAAGAFYAHSVPTDMKTLLPLYEKMGVHRICDWAWTKNRPDAPAKDGKYVGSGQVLIMSPHWGKFDGKTGRFGVGEEAVVKDLRNKIAASPYVDTVLVWHETAPNAKGAHGQWGPCAEVLGETPPPATEADVAAAKYIAECGRIVRKHFPNLKLQIGNSGSSLGAAIVPFRGGATGEFYDRLGTENPGQETMPERVSGLNGIQYVREFAEKGAKRPVALGACHEFTSRTSRELGEPTQAAYYMRDVLICLVNRMPMSNPACLVEARNAYYHTFWGANGLCYRGPTCYPKLAYLAYAVMTKVLDGATFTRLLDTGSSTVYAAEFKRDDGKYVTVLWCARGEAVAKTGWFKVKEAYSMRGRALATRKTPFGQEPSYIVSEKPLEEIEIVDRAFAKGERFFDAGKNAVKLTTAALDFSPTNAIVTPLSKCAPVFRRGAFSLRDVDDPDVGPCVELALDTSVTQYSCKVVAENVTLKLRTPQPLKAEATVIGVKVKGDSNWGQIYFTVEDADGTNWGTYRHWTDAFMSDWPGNTCVNFDGWGYIYLTLRTNDLIFDTPSDDWKKEWPGMTRPKPPFKLKAITVSRYRRPYGLFGWLESYANPTLRIHSVFAY